MITILIAVHPPGAMTRMLCLLVVCGALAVGDAGVLRKRTVPLMPTHMRSLAMEKAASAAESPKPPLTDFAQVTADEAFKILGPYLTPYVAGNKASISAPAASFEVIAEPSEYVPEPVDGPLQPNPGNFSNQPYLGGGKKVPYIVLPGKSALSPRETAAGTVGLPHPAMIRGLPLTEHTGVSTIAQVVDAKSEVTHDDEEGELNGSGTGRTQGPILYHGGEVLDHPKIYAIYYGCWGQLFCFSSPATPALIQDFVTSLSGSPWLNIATTYTDANGKALHSDVEYAGSTYVTTGDHCYTGTSLDDDGIFGIVKCVLDAKGLAWDPKGWYVVLTSAEVYETSGFCSKYCGWHAHDTWQGKNVRFGFVGSPLQCGQGCMRQQFFSPNNVPEADGMVSILAHEIVETMTDPDGNAWYDAQGAENADKCAWQYGDPGLRGLAYANIGPLKCSAGKACTSEGQTTGRYWLVQQNWVNTGNGYCANNYP